ncbi:hypothetical protein MTO96_027012 [Rhipicephalus appendiculatus]
MRPTRREDYDDGNVACYHNHATMPRAFTQHASFPATRRRLSFLVARSHGSDFGTRDPGLCYPFRPRG